MRGERGEGGRGVRVGVWVGEEYGKERGEDGRGVWEGEG